MFRTILSAQFVLAVCCVCSAQVAASEPSFEEVFAAAQKLVVNYHDAKTVQARKDRLKAVIAKYAKEPGVEKAKFDLAQILICEDSDDSFVEAAALLSELNSPSERTEFQMTVAELYLEFHLMELQRPDRRHSQRLKCARETAIAYVDTAKAKDLPAAELNGRRWLAMAEAQLGNGRDAVRELIEAVDRSEAWLASGRYKQERKKSFRDYTELQCAVHNVAGTLGGLPRNFAHDPFAMRDVIAQIDKELKARSGHFDVWHSVTVPELENWKAELPKIIQRYEPPLIQ